MELSIVIAVFNEEEVLAELERRLTAALRAMGKSYEIILVDDGSRDRSLPILLELCGRDPEHIRILSFTRNFGHHIALTAGLDQAQGSIIVMMDADLQDQPEEIPKLLAKMDEGYDVVWGERETRQFKWYKNFSSKLFLWLMNSVVRSEVVLDSSIFRAMRREVADDLRQMREKARYLPGLVRWTGYKQTSVPVVHGKRFAGQTKYSLWRLIKLALATATSFSAAPLQFATVSGMGMAALAVLAVIYILIRKVLGAYPVPGYASVMVAIFFFAALQLIVIGLMGEYVSRIYREVQGRPLYLLRELPERVAATGYRVSGGEAVRLSSLSDLEQRELVEAVAADSHLSLARVFSSQDSEGLARYHFATWEKADPYVFLHKENERITAISLLAELDWDTRLLGLSSGRILYANALGDATDARRIEAMKDVLKKATAFAREKKIRLLDARVSNEDLFVMRAFESEGFHTVDLLVTLGAAREKFDRLLAGRSFERHEKELDFGGGLRIRQMRESDVAALTHISHISYGDTSMIQDRFFLEPMIPHDRAQEVFRQWFLNLAAKHTTESLILTAELDGSVAGYIALEPMAKFSEEQWWKDSLNAVAPEARGRGVYRALVLAALEYARSHQTAGLLTKTQSSTYRVINSWLHLGGDLLESAATLHWTNS
ncbi:MAG TPA: GNAT family N-acetyltransferase [Candidatus Kapabacteria bacterium]|nr:GNAT family N-acetyltransferase [Candidatus Kapabacteria bacterium]